MWKLTIANVGPHLLRRLVASITLWEISPASLGGTPISRPDRLVTTSSIDWETVRLVYRHIWMGAAIHFRWRFQSSIINL